MPSLEVHSQHSYQKLGEKAEDLHKWMDEPAEWAGYLHRFYRHNPDNPPEWAIKRYGLDQSKKIMKNHLELDEYEDYNEKIFYFLKGLLINEKLRSEEKTRGRAVNGEIVEISEGILSIELENERFQEGDYVGYLGNRNEIIALGEVFISGKTIGVDYFNNWTLK